MDKEVFVLPSLAIDFEWNALISFLDFYLEKKISLRELDKFLIKKAVSNYVAIKVQDSKPKGGLLSKIISSIGSEKILGKLEPIFVCFETTNQSSFDSKLLIEMINNAQLKGFAIDAKIVLLLERYSHLIGSEKYL